jgi:transposase
LRLVDKHIDFGFVRDRLKDSYSETGRPSIDPELLLRILLIGYVYGITSERKLVEELRMHLAWRWFTGLGFDEDVPHHSTFSKNRHGRFHESQVFKQLFEEVVAQCLAVGLVRGDKLSVDGTFVEASASKESRIPREQLKEAAQVNRTVCEYLAAPSYRAIHIRRTSQDLFDRSGFGRSVVKLASSELREYSAGRNFTDGEVKVVWCLWILPDHDPSSPSHFGRKAGTADGFPEASLRC